MSNLYKNIATLCEEKGIKGAKLCNDIGMSKGILTDLKMGRKKSVNAETAQKIASYFGVSVGYLLGEEEKEKSPSNDGLSEGKKALIDFAMTVPDEKAEIVLRVMKSILAEI
ncbi:MAG: helix-turn-helix transcriptional regulator [Clostridia bacterium]|nr:helix-turn-helix transcriptional regulator [Clostridia bacterium]